MPDIYLCIHGHFYQPPRQNPFTGVVDREPAAAPYHDFNERIWAECYRPNADLGNFELMSFDLGPTLATWLATAHAITLRRIVAAAREARQRSGHGNALAQAYHHTILPLATTREKRVQLAWGVHDFQRRYGYAPEGIWLPETAADAETLDLLGAYGLRYTILAPWQAAVDDVDTRMPYRVAPGGDRALDAFFYNGPLSGAVSFDDGATADAARFVREGLAAHVDAATAAQGRPQLLLIATDGELYGHHKAFRDLFLKRVLRVEAPAGGYTVTTLGDYLARYPPAGAMAVRDRTSWSCLHGVARWDEGCACTPGDSSWKRPFRQALRALATRVDEIYEAETAGLLRDPWAALEDYLDLRDGAATPAAYWDRQAVRPLREQDERRLRGLLEMQFARHAMFASDAWFFEDVDRIEPRIALAYADRAVTLAARHADADLVPAFRASLDGSLSLRTGRGAADIYRELRVARGES